MRNLGWIHTYYFNNDNEAGICDCLRLPNGVYVPFSSDSFEITGTVANQAAFTQVNIQTMGSALSYTSIPLYVMLEYSEYSQAMC